MAVGRGRYNRWLLALLLAGVMAACGRSPIYHRVQPGETLYLIGQAYGVAYREIARANRLRDPSRIMVGERLLIPGAKEQVRVAALRPRRNTAVRRPSERPKDAPPLQWPVPQGAVSSWFGPRGGSFHDGIDIAAPVGAAVRAAADGQVAFNGRLPGYGNVIILRHRAGYATVYAHNDRHHVREGQRVRQGQLIATVGRTGRTTGPNLHFEVRKFNTARDPLDFLPQRLQADSRTISSGG